MVLLRSRIIAIVVVVSLLTAQYRQAHAAAPVVVAAVAAGAVLLAVAGGVQYYRQSGNNASVVSAAGQVYQNVMAYKQAADAFGRGILYQQAAAAKINAQALLDRVSSSADGVYDALRSKLTSPTLPQSGDVVRSSNGTNYKLGDVAGADFTQSSGFCAGPYAVSGPNCSGPTPSTAQVGDVSGGTSGGLLYVNLGVQSYSWNPSGAGFWSVMYKYRPYYNAGVVSGPPPARPVQPIPVSEVPAALTGGSPSGALSPDVAAELPTLISADPSIVSGYVGTGTTATGTATGVDTDDSLPPLVWPAESPYAPGSASPPVTGLGSGTTSGIQQQIAGTQQAITGIQQQIAANPPNVTELQDQLAQLQQQLAIQQSALARAQEAELDEYPGVSDVPLKSLNFDSWRALLGALSGVFPFSLLPSLTGYLQPFMADPHPPAFDLPIYGSNTIHVDLSFADPGVKVFRWALSLLATYGVCWYVVRFYRGVS